MYVCIYIHTHTHIYIYRERERETGKGRGRKGRREISILRSQLMQLWKLGKLKIYRVDH